MEQYTPKERAEVVQLYIQNNFSIVLTQRAFRKKNKVKSAPVENTIKSLYAKFVNTGNVSNASHASRQRTRPKRPLSAYMIWLNNGRESIKRENPGIKVTEVAKRGGEIWRGMNDKSEWEAKAAKAKEDYEAAVREFEANGGSTANGSAKKRKGAAKKVVKKSKKAAASDDDDDEDESE